MAILELRLKTLHDNLPDSESAVAIAAERREAIEELNTLTTNGFIVVGSVPLPGTNFYSECILLLKTPPPPKWGESHLMSTGERVIKE